MRTKMASVVEHTITVKSIRRRKLGPDQVVLEIEGREPPEVILAVGDVYANTVRADAHMNGGDLRVQA